MALNENQLQGSLNQHNKNNFWHFSGTLLEECSTQLLRGVRAVGTLAEVSVGQALGQVGVLRVWVLRDNHRMFFLLVGCCRPLLIHPSVVCY